jgi:hypothetical protein
MPFDWKSLLALARELQQQAAASSEPEPLLRSAVSRAYFAAFCHVRNYARDWLGFHPHGDADDRGRLREHLAKGKRKGLADRLEQLRQLRNSADYLDDLPWTDAPTTVTSAILTAAHVFEGFAPPKAT